MIRRRLENVFSEKEKILFEYFGFNVFELEREIQNPLVCWEILIERAMYRYEDSLWDSSLRKYMIAVCRGANYLQDNGDLRTEETFDLNFEEMLGVE
jgi:hypothetical protein